MAGRIQGITVEINGDTTKLRTALKGVNTEIRNTQGQLRDVEKLLKLDPGNIELLAQKHRLLGQAVDETRQKLETLKMAQQQANQSAKAMQKCRRGRENQKYRGQGNGGGEEVPARDHGRGSP